MSFLVNVMHMGGPFMWPLLLLAFVGWAVPLGAALFIGLRKWVPAAVFWLVPGLALTIGAIGRIQGDVMVGEAVAHASPETKSVLLHAGIGVAAYTEAAGWLIGAVLLALTALAVGIALPVGAGPQARWRAGSALAALGVSWTGAVGVVALAILLGRGLADAGPAPVVLVVVLGLGGIAIALAALRGSDEPKDAERLAAGTVAVATLVAGAALACWMFGDQQGYIQVHEAISRAAPESRATLVVMGLKLRSAALWPGVAAMGFALLAGLAASVTAIHVLVRPRPLASAAIWLGGLLLVAVPVGFGRHQAASLEARTAEAMAARLVGRVQGLPRPVRSGDGSAVGVGLASWQSCAVRTARGWVQGPGSPREGEPLEEPTVTGPDGGALLVAAPAGTRAAEVVARPWAAVDGAPVPVDLAIFVDAGPLGVEQDLPGVRGLGAGAVPFTWMPANAWQPRARAARDEPDGDELGGLLAALGEPAVYFAADDPAWSTLLFVEGRAGGVALHTVGASVEDAGELAAALTLLAANQGELSLEQVVFVPGPGWSVQDLVGHCLEAQAAFSHEGDYRVQTVTCALTAALPAEALGAARAEWWQGRGFGALGGPEGLRGPGDGYPGFSGRDDGPIAASGGDPVILGALDRSLIDAVVKRNLAQIRYCYQRELTKNPDLAGKIVVKFVVAKDGTVSSAQVKSSTMGNAAVETCINSRFMRFQFPEPRGGGIVIVSYPFRFEPG
ncbi:MAG: AgmX/PglI C-terminal domain-containing protein [Pseudomonadota bacterium]